MSAAIYISSKTSCSAEEIAVSDKYFILHMDNVSSFGEDNGLKRLDEYISYSLEDALDFIDEPSAPVEQIENNYQEEWYDPKEGLALINKYIDLVENCHSLSETSKKKCLEDLGSYQAVLESLAKENIRWHFSYDV